MKRTSEDYTMLALVEKLKELIRREKLTLELFDILDARMNWLIRFCQKNGIDIPDKEHIIVEETRIKNLMGELAGGD